MQLQLSLLQSKGNNTVQAYNLHTNGRELQRVYNTKEELE